MKLTRAQRAMLEQLSDSADTHVVVATAFMSVSGSRPWLSTTMRRTGTRSTLGVLIRLGLLESTKSDHWAERHYQLTDAGRAALDDPRNMR